MLLGAIEAGGTKFVCAVGNENYELIERVSFPTTSPGETLEKVFNFFDKFTLDAIGIGSFGPINVDKNSDAYGQILSTPKLAWKNFYFLKVMKNRYQIPLGWNTDVNAAALGEATLGGAKGTKNVLYITVGTGVGVGAVINGELLNTFGPPEMGHIFIQRHEKDDYQGFCPYHGNCLEGMTAGPSIEGRLGRSGSEVSASNEVWDYLAYYMGQALVNYTLILRPEKIILGGGVMKVPGLLGKIKKEFHTLLADYVEIPDLDRYLIQPELGDDSGIKGAMLLAHQSLQE